MRLIGSRDRELSTPYPFDDGTGGVGVGGGINSLPGSAGVTSEGEGSAGVGRRFEDRVRSSALNRADGRGRRSGLGGEMTSTDEGTGGSQDDQDDEGEEEEEVRPVFTRATSVASSWKAALTAGSGRGGGIGGEGGESSGSIPDEFVDHGDHDMELQRADGEGSAPPRDSGATFGEHHLERAASHGEIFTDGHAGSAVDLDSFAKAHHDIDGLPPAGTRPRSKRRASSGLSATNAGGGRSGRPSGSSGGGGGSRSAAPVVGSSAGWSGGVASGFLPGTSTATVVGAAGGSNAGTPGLPGLPVSGASRMAQAALKGRNKGKSSTSSGAVDKEDVAMDAVNGLSSALGLDSGVAVGRDDHPLSLGALSSRGYTSHVLFNRPFHLEDRWTNLRELGQGAYGLVVSAQDSVSGETIAIKLLTRVFDKLILAKRCLREVTLLRHLNGHENVRRRISNEVSESTHSILCLSADYRPYRPRRCGGQFQRDLHVYGANGGCVLPSSSR